MNINHIKYTVQNGIDFVLPEMVRIRQNFDCSCVDNISLETRAALSRVRLPDLSGKRIAITAGSRKIANLVEILRTTGHYLRQKGALPFVVPAMGSHGGATAAGQIEILQGLGITEKTVEMSIISDMTVEQIGRLDSGFNVYCCKTALEADGIIVCGRIKPHTSISGVVGSGLCKMMVVGLGKHKGASSFHRQGYHKLANILPEAGKVFLESKKIICGLGIVENAFDQTALIEAIPPESLIEREGQLLKIARNRMPRFLVDEIDVLVVDQFGKDISGGGLDTNITGRSITPLPMQSPVPIKTIVALDLTSPSHGNATGIGGVDITTLRVLEQVDFCSTYTNVMTSGALIAAKIPVLLNNDEEAVKVAIRCAPRENLEDVKVVRIRDTLHMTEIAVSTNYLPMLRQQNDVEILSPVPWTFDENRRLKRL